MRASRTTSAVALMLVAVLAAGCGSDDGAGNDASAGDGGATSAAVTKAKAELAQFEGEPKAPEGVTEFEPPAGKTVGIVTCGNAAPACMRMGEEAKKAAAVLGWKADVVDGKLSPQGWASANEQLINKNVDGILNIVVADGAIPQALKKARQAGIKVVCTVCANEGAARVDPPSDANADADYAAQGEAVANFAIIDSNGAAKVAILENKTAVPVVLRHDAVKKKLRSCAGCEVVSSQELGQGGDLTAAARELTTSILAAHPKGQLNYVVPPSDSQAVGAIQAIRQAHRDDVKVLSFDCELQNLEDIRAGDTEAVCMSTPLGQLAWAGIDQLARAFAGRTPPTQIVPFGVITKENAPPTGEYAEQFDFRSFYPEIWGKR